MVEKRGSAAWRPGRQILVYLGGNRGLAGLMRRLQPPTPSLDGRRACAFKVGTQLIGDDPSLRLKRLSAERYGSLWMHGSEMIEDPQWGDWGLEPLHPGSADPAPGSPVRVGIDGLDVTLPEGLTPAGFDQRLGKLLASATLAAFVLSPAGRDLCETLGEEASRFVRYSPRGAGRPRRATEITLLGRHDTGRLLRIVEHLLLDHVLAEGAP